VFTNLLSKGVNVTSNKVINLALSACVLIGQKTFGNPGFGKIKVTPKPSSTCKPYGVRLRKALKQVVSTGLQPSGLSQRLIAR
jgi:hypothetical protein